jgi:lipoprotein-anchoring transpeptidase ErfK/SrfK
VKSIIDSIRLRRPGSFWVSAALTLAALSFISIPTIATAQPRASRAGNIAMSIQTLKQSEQRWIEIDLSEQRLIAWEGSNQAFAVTVSSGKPATPTLTGIFAIQSKHVSTRMRGEGYNVPYVPYTMYYSGGYAIHGAYWHNRFGTPVSHGCVNVRVEQAQQLFDWAAVGTPVVVHN